MSSPGFRRYQFRLRHLFVVTTVLAALLGWFAVPESPAPPQVTVAKYVYDAPIEKTYFQYVLRKGDICEVFSDREPFGSLDFWRWEERPEGARVPRNRWWTGQGDLPSEPIPEKAFASFDDLRAKLMEKVDFEQMNCLRFGARDARFAQHGVWTAFQETREDGGVLGVHYRCDGRPVPEASRGRKGTTSTWLTAGAEGIPFEKMQYGDATGQPIIVLPHEHVEEITMRLVEGNYNIDPDAAEVTLRVSNARLSFGGGPHPPSLTPIEVP